MTDRQLADIAYSMLEKAYVPYSHFPVGAALLCADGTVFTGCNIENASYGATVCAERTAVFKAVSEGHRDDFVKLAVVGNTDGPCWPCALCRQILYEFAPGLEILVGNKDGELVRTTLAQLLPNAFGPKALADLPGDRGAKGEP